MKQYFINKNSDKLLLFFAGWGCDEHEFKHIETDCNLLIFYNYTDLNYDFDFSNYKEINLLAFSAGVFISSVFRFDFKLNKRLAIDGNPYLFDKHYGLSDEMLKIFRGINKTNALEFGRKYIVKTDTEYKKYNPGKRTIEDCFIELDKLEELYKIHKDKINDIFEKALFGDEDPIFPIDVQKEYFGDRFMLIDNARHNPFFRINNYNELFSMANYN